MRNAHCLRVFQSLIFCVLVVPGFARGQSLSLSSPVERQVFQRGPDNTANVLIRGTLAAPADRIEARGAPHPQRTGAAVDWTPIVSAPGAGAFSGHLRLQAGGWYWLEVRAIRSGSPAESRSLDRVGVGEVFVTCGQSNAVNYGETWSIVRTDMVSAFDGSNWAIANDPQPGSHDGSGGGSVYPKLGDKLANMLQVPVAFATTGHGGQPVEAWLWESGTGLYEWLRNRVQAFGENRPRCVLWHQGESNGWHGAPNPQNYAATLTTIVNRLNADIGYTLPWITCKATYIPGSYPNPTSDIVRAQQQYLWDSGTTLEGPDTDPYQEGYRHSVDHIHFNEAGMEVFSDLYHHWIIVGFGLVAQNTPTPGPSPTATPTPLPGCALASEGRPVEVSSVFSPEYGGEKVTDGVIGTQDGRWISASGGPHWCRIDLGEVKALCEVRVYSDEAYVSEPIWNLTAYTVRGSVDGAGPVETWPILAEFIDPCGAPYPDYPGSGVDAHNTHPVAGNYRYVALHILGGDGECGPVCRVQEVQVIAAPLPEPTPTPVPLEAFHIQGR